MTLLRLEGIDVFHGDLQAVFDLSLQVDEGETVALIGANGAGKSTILRTVIGLNRARRGRIEFAGVDTTAMRCDAVARRGVALVPEGRRLFSSLSVQDNLLLGQAHARSGPWSLQAVLELFPAIRDFRHRLAAQISGGQQQMVAIARALLSNPRLLLCDELSLGLAPKVVDDIYASFERIRDTGIGIVLVEQDVARACAAANRVVCLLKGRVTLQGAAAQLPMSDIRNAYFGDDAS